MLASMCTGSILCLNGGTCSGYGYCYCPYGYTGQICETSQFKLEAVVAVILHHAVMQPLSLLELEVCGLYNETICYNNGTCINGLCVCPSSYTGYDCSTEICECMSNIQCVLGGIVLRIAQHMHMQQPQHCAVCSALCMILGVSLHHCCRCLVLASLVCTLTFDPRHPSLSEQRELLWKHMFLCEWLQRTLL